MTRRNLLEAALKSAAFSLGALPLWLDQRGMPCCFGSGEPSGPGLTETDPVPEGPRWGFSLQGIDPQTKKDRYWVFTDSDVWEVLPHEIRRFSQL